MIDMFMLCVKSTDIMIVNFSVKRKYNGKVSTNLLTELTSIIELNMWTENNFNWETFVFLLQQAYITGQNFNLVQGPTFKPVPKGQRQSCNFLFLLLKDPKRKESFFAKERLDWPM